MNTKITRFRASLIITLTVWAGDVDAQTIGANAAASPPLGLMHLSGGMAKSAGQPAAIVATKFTVHDIAANQGGSDVINRKHGGVDVLAFDSGREWSRPVRGSPRDMVFVSFQIYASAATIVDVGGARLGVTASPAGNSVQLMHDAPGPGGAQWRPLEIHSGMAKFGGKSLAALPVLTVRLDPAAATWDLFVGGRLMADNLPLRATTPAERVFRVRAGGEGALVTGLVMADENPLYEDENGNGIDDAFERKHRGGLLTATATPAERAAWAKRWREEQRKQPPAPLRTPHLKPDRAK